MTNTVDAEGFSGIEKLKFLSTGTFFAKPKKPNEIPVPGKDPETVPAEEPEPGVWPKREPEIQPEREPLTIPPSAPPEVPKPPQQFRTLNPS